MIRPRKFSVLFAREVEALYLSPISYAVLTVGLLLNGWSFYLQINSSGGSVSASLRSFFGGSLLFWGVCLLLPPLFTMRLFSEEKRSGTLEMLLTAPVREFEVVFSKFLAGTLFYVSLWLPSLLYVAIVKSYGALPDLGVLATSYLGVFLLGSLFVAAGLFASSVTSSQILSAALATVFNLLLFLVPSLSSYVQHEEVQRFLQKLWIWQHFTDSFAKGVIDTAHVLFYLAGIGVFLFWTTRVLESQRWR